jgi:ribosomal protein L11 methyltransferase
MFVWRKRAGERWLATMESELRETAGRQLAIIQTANRRTLLAEVAGTRRNLEKLRADFGGTLKKLPRDWLQRAQAQKAKPLHIGKRLIICRSSTSTIASGSTRLLIPAGAAFGTGEHATTAMSLRLLEQLARGWPGGWSMLDIGTGSGILALAARKLGAKKVVAIECDGLAIATAKANARLNGIAGIDFRLRDARKLPFKHAFTVVTANLYSELLFDILPRLKATSRLITSGILREQERPIVRALKKNGFSLAKRRRRGKWIALLASKSDLTR